MTRIWAMPSPSTFDIPPIAALVRSYLSRSICSVDPFARNKQLATITNDLNPNTSAEFHLDARVFLDTLIDKKVAADLLLFDPPYSPRQISECYQSVGLSVASADTQNAGLYSSCREKALSILTEGAVVISCGWNSAGMGIGRGFEVVEILLVCHGAAHNDTIVTVEKRVTTMQISFPFQEAA